MIMLHTRKSGGKSTHAGMPAAGNRTEDRPIAQVPKGYLHWLYNQEFLRQPLRGQIERVLFNIPEPTEAQIIEQSDR